MEAVYFFGAFLLLVVLIYWTLSYHYRDKREQDRGPDCPRSVWAQQNLIGASAGAI